MSNEMDRRIQKYLGYDLNEPKDFESWIGATVALSMKVHNQDYHPGYDPPGLRDLNGDALSSMLLGGEDDDDYKKAMKAVKKFDVDTVSSFLDDPKGAASTFDELQLQLCWLYVSCFATAKMRLWLEEASDVVTDVQEKLTKKAEDGDEEAEKWLEELDELAAHLLEVAEEIDTQGAFAEKADEMMWILDREPDLRKDNGDVEDFLKLMDDGELLLDIGDDIDALGGDLEMEHPYDFGELRDLANSKKRARDDDDDYEDDSDSDSDD